MKRSAILELAHQMWRWSARTPWKVNGEQKEKLHDLCCDYYARVKRELQEERSFGNRLIVPPLCC